MAKAKASFPKIPTVPDQVILTMSGDEAITLRDVLYRISGHENKTRRVHTQAVLKAIDVHLPGYSFPKDLTGGMEFSSG